MFFGSPWITVTFLPGPAFSRFSVAVIFAGTASGGPGSADAQWQSAAGHQHFAQIRPFSLVDNPFLHDVF